MSGAPPGHPRGPGPGAAAGTVFRSELNPVDFLHRAAYLDPGKVAVAAGQRRYGYRELAERPWRLASALGSAGLAKGGRVATLLVNSPAMPEAHSGVPAAGGILVAVSNRLSSAEAGYILRHSGMGYLLPGTGLAPVTGPPGLAGVTVIRCDDTGVPPGPYEEFLAGAAPARPASWLEREEETISVNCTSGTTGRPRGVQYTCRGAYLNALSEVIAAGMGTDPACLRTLPMFRRNSWCFPWAVTAVAARHVTMRAVDPGLIRELIDGEGVTHYNGDLAVWHPGGNIELRDRGKDIIISGGENISSIEAGQAIAAHPAVLECAVTGIPHPHRGERPKAFVTLSEGTAAAPEEIIAFCREHLAHCKCPDSIESGPLPKTSTGKTQKFVPRQRERADQDTQAGGVSQDTRHDRQRCARASLAFGIRRRLGYGSPTPRNDLEPLGAPPRARRAVPRPTPRRVRRRGRRR
ncbi:MAG: AMP-binding protein [Streptosporangiaceae bacterium]